MGSIISNYCEDKLKESGVKDLINVITKLWGYTQEILPEIKYKSILDKSSVIAEKFLYFFDLSIKEKDDDNNNIDFKQFDNKIVKEIISHINLY